MMVLKSLELRSSRLRERVERQKDLDYAGKTLPVRLHALLLFEQEYFRCLCISTT